jgi:hypothetical protein
MGRKLAALLASLSLAAACDTIAPFQGNAQYATEHCLNECQKCAEEEGAGCCSGNFHSGPSGVYNYCEFQAGYHMETKESYGSDYLATDCVGDSCVYSYYSDLTAYSGCVSGSPLPSGTCACDKPGQGNQWGNNRYTCADGTRGYCAENEECYSGDPFDKGEWDQGCRVVAAAGAAEAAAAAEAK